MTPVKFNHGPRKVLGDIVSYGCHQVEKLSNGKQQLDLLGVPLDVLRAQVDDRVRTEFVKSL